MSMGKENLKEKMKMGLGGGLKAPTIRDNPFNPTTEPAPVEQSVAALPTAVTKMVPKAAPAPLTEVQEKKLTKAEVFTERVTLVISTEQRDRVEALAKAIQRNGQKKPERITANTVMRSLITLLDGFDGDITQLADEEELRELFRKHFRKPSK
jgi:hypothetical protein